jgi:eukaryotic-like serine/threonine-protein kinase
MGVTERSPDVADETGSPEQRPPAVLAFGPFAFDTRSRLLSRDGLEVPLPPRVLGVLERLLQRAGDVVARQELIDTVWKDAFVTDTSLAEAVSVLRQVLGDDPQAPTYIQTLHRRGYRFVSAVTPRERAGPGAAGPVASDPGLDTQVSLSIGRELVPWSAAAICFVIAVVAVWQATRRTEVPTPAPRFQVSPADGTSFDAAAPALAISPDGTHLAWSACATTGCRLYLRAVDRLDVSPVPGTEDAHAPFFSPDGRWIGFFADGRLKKVSLGGGAPVTLADAPSMLGGAWLGNDIVFGGGASGGLMRVSASGGEPRRLTRPRESDGEVRHAWPSLVPGQQVLLFTIATMPDDEAPGLLAALSLEAAGPGEATSWRTLAEGIHTAHAAGGDAIVFARGSELHAVRFDPIRMAIAGAPRAVLPALGVSGGRAHYALSASGSLVFASAPGSGDAASGAADRDLVWWSPSGGDNPAAEIRGFRSPALSPDGRRLAGVSPEGTGRDLWLADVQRGAATRVTHGGINASPVWSADGRTLYFAARTTGTYEIWSRDADATRPAAREWNPGRHAFPLAASPDGKLLAFVQASDGTGADIWALPLLGGEPQARPLVQGPFDEGAGSFSPDSRLLAFQSSETGRWEIYVQRLADRRRVLVSTDGGERPIWNRDGLYYQSKGRIVRATISDSGDNLVVGQILTIADLRGGRLRAISPDGRALVARTADLSNSSAIVSIDWLRELGTMLGPAAAPVPR